METQLLEVFRTVARFGSITAAARHLRFTQSAVSRQIAALEAEIGARVFDRLPRGVALSEEGRILLPHAEALLDRLDTVRRDLDELRGLGAGRLRVGAFPTAVAALVPRALASFRAAHPQVALSLVEGTTPALLDRLTAAEADVAVVSTAPTAQLDTVRFELYHLVDERLLVAVSRDHRLARRRAVRLAELSDDPFIVGSATDEENLLRASLPDGFPARIDIVAAEWTGKLGCVAAGLGVALVPALAVRGTPADIRLLYLHPEDESVRRIFAATVSGRSRPPAVSRFLTHLQQAAREFGA
ncbi:LysR family transcriptional regulator [Micromonospora endophytica]|uniref:LysR family transcriptional regulator n=1 Tax=Micromonospora endophytica TaxID=515350 RepID=A0A2W2CFQ7_9ACTN|nr:LysR family transcriptional regulator [Micromonospora endophytica]PZF97382.1 LysR family transcriptional regulator [Micromonospora endophytica]RIW42360.1 LysR family transcriptional regulator [Micromonospora endophytica]BCJ57051.1 LysR family transcriptional regulator [Micromonospora endophytica]